MTAATKEKIRRTQKRRWAEHRKQLNAESPKVSRDEVKDMMVVQRDRRECEVLHDEVEKLKELVRIKDAECLDLYRRLARAGGM